MLFHRLLYLFFALLFCSSGSANTPLEFPDRKQRTLIAEELLSGIERVDALSVDIRNASRRVTWSHYKQHVTDNIAQASDWSELYRALDNVHYGIVNRHSHLKVAPSIQKLADRARSWPAFEIGYTWPELSFFSIKNNKTIKTIDQRAVSSLFDDFYNLYCNDAHQSGCLRLFVRYMASGYMFVGNKDALAIGYSDGSVENLTKLNQGAKKPKQPISCKNLFQPLDLTLVYDGAQSCLYERENSFVLKLFYFGGWGTHSNDIYCTDHKKGGMCGDIKKIAQITRSRGKPKALVIDVQNNGGGSENTPWIAALTKSGFKDNTVQYKNLPELSHANIRKSAFYASEAAERWYQKFVHNNDIEGDFLPIRADFCRGSETCLAESINSSEQTIDYSNLILVVNGGCASSCDDLVWRLKQYAGAEVFGQLPATDGTYARLNGYLYLSRDLKPFSVFAGEGQKVEHQQDTRLLLQYRVPISKTVTTQGEPLEGVASVLDHPLSVTRENYNRIELANLQRAIGLLEQ